MWSHVSGIGGKSSGTSSHSSSSLWRGWFVISTALIPPSFPGLLSSCIHSSFVGLAGGRAHRSRLFVPVLVLPNLIVALYAWANLLASQCSLISSAIASL
eukprot:6420429-Pyramimonas_sp.AAC.1